MSCDILLVCCHVLLCAKDFKAHIPYSLYGVRDQGPLTTRLYQRDVPAFKGFALSALVLSLGAVALLAVPYFTDVT